MQEYVHTPSLVCKYISTTMPSTPTTLLCHIRPHTSCPIYCQLCQVSLVCLCASVQQTLLYNCEIWSRHRWTSLSRTSIKVLQCADDRVDTCQCICVRVPGRKWSSESTKERASAHELLKLRDERGTGGWTLTWNGLACICLAISRAIWIQASYLAKVWDQVWVDRSATSGLSCVAVARGCSSIGWLCTLLSCSVWLGCRRSCGCSGLRRWRNRVLATSMSMVPVMTSSSSIIDPLMSVQFCWLYISSGGVLRTIVHTMGYG